MDRKTQRRQGKARVINLHDDDGAFDREFWQTIPPHERLALVWDMVLETQSWRGTDGSESRLQRSVCRIERR
jgi:hypothetical protein